MKAMRTRSLAVIGCLSLAAAALALTQAPLDAQAQKPATPVKTATPAKAAIPRLADGHPERASKEDRDACTEQNCRDDHKNDAGRSDLIAPGTDLRPDREHETFQRDSRDDSARCGEQHPVASPSHRGIRA